MPKTLLDWILALLVSGLLIWGFLRTRILPSRWCAKCGGLLKRRPCSYNNRPVEEVTCDDCGDIYIQTPWKIITSKDDPNIKQNP